MSGTPRFHLLHTFSILVSSLSTHLLPFTLNNFCSPNFSPLFQLFFSLSSFLLFFFLPLLSFFLVQPSLIFPPLCTLDYTDTISTRIICEGDQLQLSCSKSSRIVVFRAWFGILGPLRPSGSAGQLTASGFSIPSVTCSQTITTSFPSNSFYRNRQKIPDKKELSESTTGHTSTSDPSPSTPMDNVDELTNCRLTQVTQAIVRLCQGRRKCSLTVEKSVLSYTESGQSPLRTNCQESSSSSKRIRGLSNQLKVQYTCASKGIFKPATSLSSTNLSPSEKNPPDENEPDENTLIDPSFKRTANPNAAKQSVIRNKKGDGEGRNESDGKKENDISSEEQLDPQASQMAGFESDWKVESAIPTPVVVRSSYPSTSPSSSNEGERRDGRKNEEATTQSNSNCTIIVPPSSQSTSESIGFSGDWISAYIFISRRLLHSIFLCIRNLLYSIYTICIIYIIYYPCYLFIQISQFDSR